MDVKNISKGLKILGGTISKNSSTILTYAAVGGVLTTTAAAVSVTPTALAIIDEELYERFQNDAYEEDGTDINQRIAMLPKKDIIRLTWKLYIPSLFIGGATIACIIGANSINQRRNAALASAYGLTEAAFKEYKEKVVETLGKGKERKVRDSIASDRVQANPPGKNEVMFTGKGEVLCMVSGRYFKSDIDQINKAINQINKDLRTNMWMSVNDFYYELGLAADPDLGDLLGWSVDDGLEVSFSSCLTEKDEPCLVLSYQTKPKYMD